MVALNHNPAQSREAKLDEVREHLNAQVENLVTGEDWKRALSFAAKFRSRSVNNSWLIFAQHQAAWETGRSSPVEWCNRFVILQGCGASFRCGRRCWRGDRSRRRSAAQ